MILPFSFLQYRLKAMIPVMTSNTSPSGVASASNGGTDAWTAFTPSTLDGWISPGVGVTWIQYKFPRPTTCNKMILTVAKTGGGTFTLVLSGSNDGSAFTNLVSFDVDTTPIIMTPTVPFSNNTSYLYYRITLPNNVGFTFDAIQLYGF